MTLVSVTDDFPSQNIERRKQSRCAVLLVVVRHGAVAPFLRRQPGLAPLQSLNSALLVHTKRHCLVGRIQTKTDHVGELLQSFGSRDSLNVLVRFGLIVMAAPCNATGIQAGIRRHSANQALSNHALKFRDNSGGAGA